MCHVPSWDLRPFGFHVLCFLRPWVSVCERRVWGLRPVSSDDLHADQRRHGLPRVPRRRHVALWRRQLHNFQHFRRILAVHQVCPYMPPPFPHPSVDGWMHIDAWMYGTVYSWIRCGVQKCVERCCGLQTDQKHARMCASRFTESGQKTGA